MRSESMRVPAIFYICYASLGLAFTHRQYINSLWRTESLNTEGSGTEGALLGHYGPVAALLTPLILALVPAIGALAGATRSASDLRPSVTAAVLFAVISMIPLVLADWLQSPWGVLPAYGAQWYMEVLLYLVLAVWILAPVFLVKRLHNRASR